MQEIAGYAFYGCSALTDIYFPTYVDYIGAYAFYQSGLTTAVFECPTNWNLFGKWNNGYPAHLSPTDSANAAKALSTNYTSHTSSDFLQKMHGYEMTHILTDQLLAHMSVNYNNKK